MKKSVLFSYKIMDSMCYFNEIYKIVSYDYW